MSMRTTLLATFAAVALAIAAPTFADGGDYVGVSEQLADGGDDVGTDRSSPIGGHAEPNSRRADDYLRPQQDR